MISMARPDGSASKIVRIFKNSASYLIYLAECEGELSVCKIAHLDGAKLDREIARIEALREAYPGFKRRLVGVERAGKISTGEFTGKHYYLSKYVRGETFSHWIQSPTTEIGSLRNAYNTILPVLFDLSSTQRPCEGSWKTYIATMLREELSKLESKPMLRRILSSGEIVVDGTALRSLPKLVDELLSNDVVMTIDTLGRALSDLGHWNFHGDNVVVPDILNPSEFKVIDPDVSIVTSDPLFGVARFLYTYSHDTADYRQYYIHTRAYVPFEAGRFEFEIRRLWPEVVARNYEDLFGRSLQLGLPGIKGVPDELAQVRLAYCYLCCLIRGVNANFEDRLEFEGDRLDLIRNKSIFLLLAATKFANALARNMSGSIS